MPVDDRLMVTLTVSELRELLKDAASGFSASIAQAVKEAVGAIRREMSSVPVDIPERSKPSENELIRVKDVARLLGVSERLVWRMASCGMIPPPIRVGGTACRWRRKDIELVVETKAGKAEAKRQKLAKTWGDPSR